MPSASTADKSASRPWPTPAGTAPGRRNTAKMRTTRRCSTLVRRIGRHADGSGRITLGTEGRTCRRSKPTDQPHEPALDVDLVGAEDAGLVLGVGGFERDGGALLAQALEGGLLLLDHRHDDVAVLGRV